MGVVAEQSEEVKRAQVDLLNLYYRGDVEEGQNEGSKDGSEEDAENDEASHTLPSVHRDPLNRCVRNFGSFVD